MQTSTCHLLQHELLQWFSKLTKLQYLSISRHAIPNEPFIKRRGLSSGDVDWFVHELVAWNAVRHS